MKFFKKVSDNYLLRDLGVVGLSIIIAIILVKTGVLISLLESTRSVTLVSTFVSGLFFTSIFTTAPATVALAEIARGNSLLVTAAVGGFGAMLGDLLIFRFVKDRLAEDIYALVKHSAPKRLAAVFKWKFLRWFFAFLGALIIASPLPDELGLAMMGMTKVKTAIFIPLSFAFNALGILIIGLVARSL